MQGNTKINKLSLINIYEVDYKVLSKVVDIIKPHTIQINKFFSMKPNGKLDQYTVLKT